MHHRLRYLLILLLGVIAVGCASTSSRTDADYQTISDQPGRYSDAAARHNRLALRLLAEERLEEAEQELKKALEADVTFGPAHNNLGKVYYHQGRFYQAAWEFEYAAKLMPHQPEPRNNLGLVFEAAGRLDEAIDQYRQAMDLEPDGPQVLGNLARARIRRGDRGQEVRDLLEQVIAKDNRPDWINWAREKLILMPPARADQVDPVQRPPK